MTLTSGLQSNDRLRPPTMTSTTSPVTNKRMLTTDESLTRSPTFIPNHVGTKSMRSADNKQTESTFIHIRPFSGDYAVGVAVGGLLMVVVVVAVIVITLLSREDRYTKFLKVRQSYSLNPMP